MNSPTIFDELDQAIDQMMAEPDSAHPGASAELSDLLDVASELRHLPRPDFKMRLKAELEWQNWSPGTQPRLETPPSRRTLAEADMAPTLSGNGYGLYPVRRINFAASV